FCCWTGSGDSSESKRGPKMAAKAVVSLLLTAVVRALTASSGEAKVLPILVVFTHKAGCTHKAAANSSQNANNERPTSNVQHRSKGKGNRGRGRECNNSTMGSFLSPRRMHWDHEPGLWHPFGVLVFSRRHRRSPLSLRPPATVCEPFGL